MKDDVEVLLDLNFDGLISSLQHLTRLYEANKEKLDKMKEAGEQNTKAFVELQQTQKVLRQEMAGVEKQIQSEIKAQKANEGSLIQMRAELQRLNKQYDSMSGFARMSEQGTQLQQRISALSAEIQGLEENTGRWQRNVGNYQSALKGLKDSTEAVGLSSQGLDRIMKGLSGNPWIMIVEVLVAVLVKLRDRMKGTEQVTASLGKAMDSLKPITEWFGKAINKLADIFSNVLDWAIDKTIEALGWLGRQLQKIGKIFNKDWGSGLIEYSSNMKQTANATTEAAEATDTLNESMAAVSKTAEKTREKMEDLLSILKRIQQESKKESLFEALMKAGGTKTGQQTIEGLIQSTEEYGEAVGNVIETMGDIPDSMKPSLIEKFAASFTNNAKDIESVAGSLSSSFGSVSSMYEQLAKDETKSEAEREKAAKNAKKWAAAQLAANSATAIAKGVAQAVETPFPANIAAIATTLAAVLSAIAQAKALQAESHEHGGIIGGAFIGATRGRDNVTFNGRAGEMVLNADQQKTLFDIANGGTASSLAASLAVALQSMPAPVLEYSEFTRFSDRVATLDNNSKLK